MGRYRRKEHLDPITSGAPSDAEREFAEAWNLAGSRGQIAAHHYYIIDDNLNAGGTYFYLRPRRPSALPKGKVLWSGKVPHHVDLFHGILGINGKHINTGWEAIVGKGDGLPIVSNSRK